MDGSAGPPAGYARATILQTENRQTGRALAHGRLTPPLVAHHAGQRRFARYSNRGASHERQAMPDVHVRLHDWSNEQIAVGLRFARYSNREASNERQALRAYHQALPDV